MDDAVGGTLLSLSNRVKGTVSQSMVQCCNGRGSTLWYNRPSMPSATTRRRTWRKQARSFSQCYRVNDLSNEDSSDARIALPSILSNTCRLYRQCGRDCEDMPMLQWPKQRPKCCALQQNVLVEMVLASNEGPARHRWTSS